MTDLNCLQEELYALLRKNLDRQFFLRRSRTPDTLWVSDYTMRGGVLPVTLGEHGFTAWERDGLLRLDLTEERLRKELTSLPAVPPMDTANDVTALARLLLAHPAPEEAEAPDLLRACWLMTALPAKEREIAARKLIRVCAERLRRHEPLCETGGRLLAVLAL